MNRKIQPIALAFLVLFPGGLLLAAPERSVTERRSQRVPISPDGAVVIDNGVGSVEVTGTSDRDMEVTAVWTIRGVDNAALQEGKRQTQIIVGGNLQTRIVRTIANVPANRRWSLSVNYTLRVPRSVDVSISNTSVQTTETIKVTNIAGNVRVKNVNGPIQLFSILGPMRIESINGNIFSNYTLRPTTNALFWTVNGQVEIRAPRDSALIWQAETLKGDVLTTLPLRPHVERRQSGTRFHGVLNGGTSPILRTVSMMGRVYLLPNDVQIASARSVLPRETAVAQGRPPNEDVGVLLRRISSTLLLQPPSARTFVAQRNVIDGNFEFQTTMGNVFMGEIRGEADIATRAGEIVLGRVLGRCSVISLGGPINLGDIQGELVARTAAGDVHVRAARKGGVVFTEGGNIHVIYAGGPITLHSGGGDVTLRQASGPVKADTKSGDITITVDPQSRTETIDAQTIRGNVTLNLARGFAADLDITVLTSTANADRIHSEFGTLSIIREQVGNRTRIRGIGRINGGGGKVTLTVDEGDVHIRSQSVPQIVIAPVR